MESNVKLSSPWIDYVHKLEAFFQKDPDVNIVFNDGEERKINIYVEKAAKAEALEELLPTDKTFGNVTVAINVIPANFGEKIDLFRNAFEGNDAVSYIETISPPFTSNPFHYIVFQKEVVQYWNDNLGDINGVRSTLYQDLAKEIFEDLDLSGIYFCTDVDDPEVVEEE